MQNTTKSKLLVELENHINSCSSGTIDVRITDGMFFLHLFVDLPLRTEIHLIFDKIISLSIKDSERNKRDDNRHVAYQITGAEQKRPSNWLQSLRVDQFKGALVEFLVTFWESNELSFIIGSKKIFVNSGDTCFSFCNEGGFMVKKIEEEYRCSHEEADSRMLFHLSKCSTPSNIVIRTVDTDVLITALGSLHLLAEGKQVWIET